MTEPRFILMDTETGKRVELTTDEVQAALFLAERELRRQENDPKTSKSNNQLPTL